jgi:hypothetical protein
MTGLRAETSAGVHRRTFLGAAAVATLAVLAGCQSTKIPDPESWKVVELEGGAARPVPNDPSRRTRVVVLPSEESPSAPRGANLAARATAALEQLLGGGGVEIIDRSLANRLDRELKLAEMNGTGSYGGPEVADYVIRVKMGNAIGGSTYVQASQFKNPLNGQIVNVPAGYTHNGKSLMTIEIRSLPALKLVETLQAEGSVSASQQPSPGNPIALVQGATDDGVRSKRSAVLNVFAPKGYISERRVHKDESIFRVQLGRNTGTKEGDTIEIWRTNPNGDEIAVGKGVMSNIVGTEGSWIKVSDPKVASRVRGGDYVKVKHGGWMDMIPANITNILK